MLTNEPALSHEDIKRYLKEGRGLRSEIWIGVATRTAKSLRHVISRCVTVAINVARRSVGAMVRTHRRDAYIRELAALNDRTLKDIGLHRSEIRSAVNELFDDTPPSRLRHPAWIVRTGTIQKAGKAAANDESFVDSVSGYR